MHFFRKRISAPDPTPATKITLLTNSHAGLTTSQWSYTQVEEPEQYSPVPHELAVEMETLPSLERDIFARIDAIHSAGGLDEGHFDVFDVYLARKRACVEASIVQEREWRRKTAGRLTAIQAQRYALEAKLIEPIRAQAAQLKQLRDVAAAELYGTGFTPVQVATIANSGTMAKPLELPSLTDMGALRFSEAIPDMANMAEPGLPITINNRRFEEMP